MKRVVGSWWGLALVLGGLAVAASGSNPGTCVPVEPAALVCPPGPPALTPVAPADLLAELDAGDVLLVNVHVPYQGEIPGTDVHLTYLDVPAIAEYIGPDLATPVTLYCMTNHMAVIAGDQLLALGYCNVRTLEGGMRDWMAAGYPMQ